MQPPEPEDSPLLPVPAPHSLVSVKNTGPPYYPFGQEETPPAFIPPSLTYDATATNHHLFRGLRCSPTTVDRRTRRYLLFKGDCEIKSTVGFREGLPLLTFALCTDLHGKQEGASGAPAN